MGWVGEHSVTHMKALGSLSDDVRFSAEKLSGNELLYEDPSIGPRLLLLFPLHFPCCAIEKHLGVWNCCIPHLENNNAS